MADNTQFFSLPYPEGHDPVVPHEDIQALAESVDTSLKVVAESIVSVELSAAEKVERIEDAIEVIEQDIIGVGLVNIDQIMADLAFAQAELERYREEASRGQGELDAALEELNEVRLPALTDSLNDALADFDVDIQSFNTRVVEAEAAVAEAEVKLEDARTRLNAAESDIEAANTAVSNAQATADQAVQDALDAAGIASEAGRVITQISAPTGSRARAENLWVRLPDHKVHIYDGSKWVAATDPDLIAAAQDAGEALNLANEAADDLALLQLSVEGAGGLNDRLQQAENELETKADTSQLNQLETNLSAHDAQIQAAQTEITNAKSRLSTAEGNISDARAAADAAAADVVATREHLENVIASLDFGDIGKIWAQADPPPAGVTYAFTGNAHESQSVRLDENSVEVARNRIVNGDFEGGETGWGRSRNTFVTSTAYNHQMWGGLGGRLAQVLPDTDTRYASINQYLGAVSAGEWVGVSAYVATRTDTRIRIQFTWNHAEGTTWTNTGWIDSATFYSGHHFHWVSQAEYDVSNLYMQIQVDKTEGDAGKHFWVDKVVMAVADTQQDAHDQTVVYWDGDTPDDRASDIWYDDDGIAHTWEKGSGWRVLEDTRITEAIAKAAAAQQKADALETQLNALENTVESVETRLDTAEQNIQSKVDSSRVDQIEGNVNTALTQDITHDRLRVGSGAFDEAFVDELWINNLYAISAELARVVVAAPNFAPPPGEFPDEWRVDSPWELREVSGLSATHAFRATPDSSQGRVFGPRFPVTPGETLKFDFDYGRIGANRAEGGSFLVGMLGYTQQEGGSAASFGPYIEGDEGSGTRWTDSAGWGTHGTGTVVVPEGVTWAAPTLYVYPATGTPRQGAHTTIYNLRVTKMVDGSLVVENTIDTRHLNVTEDMTAAIIRADTVEVADLIAEDLIAKHLVAVNGTFAQLTSTEKANFVKAFADEIWADSGFFGTLDAREAYIGGAQIVEGAISAREIKVTGELLTDIFAANSAVINEHLVVNGDITTDYITSIAGAFENLTATGKANFVNVLADELYAERFVAESASIVNLAIASPNKIPGMFDIANSTPPPFVRAGFGRNPSHPSIWVQGRTNALTSNADDALIYLETGKEYRFSVEATASVANTRYYIQLRHLNGGSAQNVIVNGQPTSYLLSNEIAGGGHPVWFPRDATFMVGESAGYRLQIWANHPNGASNTTGYQWFRDLRIEDMQDGNLIVPGTISARQIDAYEIFTDTFVANTINTEILQTKLVNADQAWIGGSIIKNNAITTTKINAEAVTAGKIATNAVTTNKIYANAVTAGKIATSAITADKISSNAVTSIKINAEAITASKIAANAVTTDKLSANAITAKHTITGATIQTATSGSRVVLSGNKMSAYNSSGTETARYSGDGIMLRPPGGSLTQIGSHIFGASFFSSVDRARNHTDNTWSTYTTGSSLGTMYMPSNRVMISISFEYRMSLMGANAYVGIGIRPQFGSAQKTRTISPNNQQVNTMYTYAYSDIFNVPQGTTQSVFLGLRARALYVTIHNFSMVVTPV